MKAMLLEQINNPLVERDIPIPTPRDDELLVKVSACGVCRTDLHAVDGELPQPKLPLILGHQIVGTVVQVGAQVDKQLIGRRVGVPWMGGCCDQCAYCHSKRENLCDRALFTGYTLNGGYAEYCTVREDFALDLPDHYDARHMAPLLCAGLIGYRAFRFAGEGKSIGFYGFGSSAHILIQVAKKLNRDIYVFTRPGDRLLQEFAQQLGAKWVGGSDELPPEPLDAAILFAPVGALFPQALKAVKKGGRVVSAGIHMSDIPAFPYALLWEERTMTSVANLTRQDGQEFMQLIQTIPIETKVTVFPLEEANAALALMRKGGFEGSLVLSI